MTKPQVSLPLCIMMDILGYATYALPFFGEFGDLLWAPFSAFIFYRTFGGTRGTFGALFNFAEEILPFTDFIPSFTIMYIWQRVTQQQEPRYEMKDMRF